MNPWAGGHVRWQLRVTKALIGFGEGATPSPRGFKPPIDPKFPPQAPKLGIPDGSGEFWGCLGWDLVGFGGPRVVFGGPGVVLGVPR